MSRYLMYSMYYIFFFLRHRITIAGETEFGTNIRYFCINDINKQILYIPTEKTITNLFFFNFDNQGQCNILSNLISSFSNYLTQENITLIGISMGSDEQSKTIRRNFNLTSKAVNDIVGKNIEAYDYTCGGCFSLYIINKNGIVRYSQTRIYYYMMSKIIERYLGDKKNYWTK